MVTLEDVQDIDFDDLTPAEQRRLALAGDEDVRVNLLSFVDLDTDVQEELSLVPDLQEYLADNPYLTPQAFENLRTADNDVTYHLLCENPLVSDNVEWQLALAGDPDPARRALLAANGVLGDATETLLASDKDVRVRKALAQKRQFCSGPHLPVPFIHEFFPEGEVASIAGEWPADEVEALAENWRGTVRELMDALWYSQRS